MCVSEAVSKRRQQVAKLLKQGLTQREIGRRLGFSDSVVSRDARFLGLARGRRLPTKFDWTAIRAFYDAGHSRQECQAHFSVSSGAFDLALARGDIVPREEPDPVKHSHKTRAAVAEGLAAHKTQAQVARELGISKSTVAFHARQLGVAPNEKFNRRYDWAEIQQAHDAGMRAGECCRHFGCSKATWTSAVRRGDIVPRDWRLPLERLLISGRSETKRGHLKQRLISAGLKEPRCEQCGITHWRGVELSLQLHHKNGDGLDNRLENLEMLCANCHSLTENWGGRNRRRMRAA